MAAERPIDCGRNPVRRRERPEFRSDDVRHAIPRAARPAADLTGTDARRYRQIRCPLPSRELELLIHGP